MKIWQWRVIGILTLGGGAVGVATSLSLLLSLNSVLDWAFCLVFLSIYSWGIWCGVRLLERQSDSIRNVIWYWLLQIPVVGSPFFGYFLSSVFHTTVALQFAPLNVNANFLLGSKFQYSLMQSDQPWLFGVNLFAVAVVWWLSRKGSPVAS